MTSKQFYIVLMSGLRNPKLLQDHPTIAAWSVVNCVQCPNAFKVSGELE